RSDGGPVHTLTAAAILFDMDGVLLDSRPVVERTWRRWAERHGLSAEAVLRVAHGRRTRDTLQVVAPDLATDQEVVWLDAAELEDFAGIRPIAGAHALVASLPSDRWTVVTSAGRELAARRLAKVGLTLPAHAVTSEDVQNGKPAPDGYLLAAARLGVSTAECVVVEDAPPGIESGRACEARVIAVATTQPREALTAADLIISDLDSLVVIGITPLLRLAVIPSMGSGSAPSLRSG
ncbi:MAG TPA: HAD-IA family hydrolase, partial [Gemmatimonadales bacterium]|nr:HAD-IA family hydrolase [Gemmatimonadales bacterium]